jgi:hypothetical protein
MAHFLSMAFVSVSGFAYGKFDLTFLFPLNVVLVFRL